METLLESDPDIRKAHNIYQEFSSNSDYREIYEARLKWQKDYEGRLNYEQKKAREEGLEEGIEQGIEKGIEKGEVKGKTDTAREFLKMGMSVDVVAKGTGLSHEFIESLKEKL